MTSPAADLPRRPYGPDRTPLSVLGMGGIVNPHHQALTRARLETKFLSVDRTVDGLEAVNPRLLLP